MDKIDKVLDLISEKSEMLHITYGDYTKEDSEAFEEQANECLSQITILNELYNEVKLIKAEDV